MSRSRVPLSAAFLVFTLTALTWGTVQAVPPVEAYGRLPMINDVQISPDGKHIAMLQSVQGKAVVTVYTVGAAPGTKPVVVNPSKGKVRLVRWANNERLLVWLSTTWTSAHLEPRKTYEIFRLTTIKADATDLHFVFHDYKQNFAFGSGRILSLLPDDLDHILMIHWDAMQARGGGVATGSNIPDEGFDGVSVYKVDVNDGRYQRIEMARQGTDDWIIDPRGRVRVRIDQRKQKNYVYARDGGSGTFREIAEYDEDDRPGGRAIYYGFYNDLNQLYVTARKDTDKVGAYTMDLATGQLGNKVFLHDRYDVGSMVTDSYTDRVIGVRYTDDLLRTVYFDPAFAALQGKLEKAFKGQSVIITSMTEDRNAIILLVRGLGKPDAYYYFDAKTHRASFLSSAYPDITPDDLGNVKAISYKARDGLTIPAYLTLPPSREAGNLPLVVLPHGGPEYRDNQDFHWWAQFYASRGYAVLQPNYRGSSGYGEDFVKLGYGEWGSKMQDDLTDGVKYLIAEGIADPRRVCIVGGSYGGYAALAGATFTPEIYACVVSVAGVSDLPTMIGQWYKGRADDSYSTMYWERWLGNRVSDQDNMAAASPARHAGKVRAPVLIIHGKDDTVVPFYQTELMVKALRKAGKPYRLIALEGEDHWLTKAESRIRVLKETEAFLKENIGN